MPELHTLCLFRNRIAGLEAAIASLRLCPKLRSLDLDGNPLALEPGYRHHVVRTLVRLEAFDTEPVRSLDRELAREFFAQAQTAPQAVVSDGPHRFKWNSLPKGKVRLFDSDKLNNNPVALTYLANHLVSEPVAPESAASPTNDDDRTDESRRSFVGRLRDNTQREQEETPQVDEDDDERGLTSQRAQRAIAALEQSHAPVTSATDASDPYQTIRRLIQYIEILQRELADRRDSSATTRDSSEIEQLRVENANMYQLREANAALRKDVQTLRARVAKADELAKDNRHCRESLAASHAPVGTFDECRTDDHTDESTRNEGLENVSRRPVSSPRRPASGRSSTGGREARALKAQASVRDVGSPTISDILLLRSTSGNDDASWEAMSTPRRRAQDAPTSDKVVCTRHAWVLLDNSDDLKQ